MKTVQFIFGIHNHQPVGNFDHVFEHAFQNSYLPFLKVVKKFPEISLVLHFSGCLLEWLEKNHPEYIEDVVSLVKRGNVELLSGGFYEPILIMIPDEDKIGQIEKMNAYIRDRFHYEPEGLWLTERVWEAHLPRPLAKAGIRYVTVDDYHFISSGKTERELTGYFITDEQGYPLAIFPISQNLRYAIPFKDPQETIEYLRGFATENGDQCVVMVDDGEKFGVWPGTHQTVFKEKWLYRFFQALLDNKEWIRTTTFKEYYHSYPSRGRIYLPSASYFEMSEWTLPPSLWEKFDNYVNHLKSKNRLDTLKPFIKGGVWRNFLYKYSESNWMQKKMLWLSERLHSLEQKLPENNPDREALAGAKTHLWRGMCNCAYWHGIFGGLYLPHLRQAIYHELIQTENFLDSYNNNKTTLRETLDIDKDGNPEIRLANDDISLICSPHRSGIIEEISLKKFGFNLLNTLQRYREGYHKKVLNTKEQRGNGGSIHEMVTSKEEHLERYLIYDRFPRKAAVDHVIHPSVTLEDFRNMHYDEMSSFLRDKYKIKSNRHKNSIELFNQGWIDFRRADIEKIITLDKSTIRIEYFLTNRNQSIINFRFAPEFNFALLGGNAPDRYYRFGDAAKKFPLNSIGEWNGYQFVSVTTEWEGFTVELNAEDNHTIWTFPIETVSLSEAGFERVYQSSVICPLWDFSLKPGEKVKVSVILRISPFRR